MSSPSKTGDPTGKPGAIPCKIWDSTRTRRKSVVAIDLAELISEDLSEASRSRPFFHISVGKRKLDISADESVRIVLEEDGTEVDDNEYFRLIPDFSTFLLLREQDTWLPNSCTVDGNRRMFADWDPRRPSISTGNDSASGSTYSTDSDAVDSAANPTRDRATILFEQLYAGNAYKQLLPWLLLRPLDLEEIVNADPANLAVSVGCPRHIVDQVQEMSHKALSDYNNAQKAVQILSIYDQAVNLRSSKQK